MMHGSERWFRSRRPLVVSLAALLVVSTSSIAFAADDAQLRKTLLPLIEKHEGKVAVAVKHLTTGASFAHDAKTPMPTASLIKFPVMIEAYRQAKEGKIDLAGMTTLREADKVPGSGILRTHFSDGATISLRDCVRLMIAISDNTATNLVIDRIGLGATSETMERMGHPETKIHAKVFRRDTSLFPDRSREYGLGSTTADDMIRLLEALERRELVDAEASEAMLEHLAACEDDSKLARFLPKGTKRWHKGGAVSTARTNAGIIETPSGPVAVCVLTRENKDRRWDVENAGNRLCADIGRAVYERFSDSGDSPKDKRPARLKVGASGRLVEALQRTLNARSTPKQRISVDGGFGPITRAAVERFQQGNGIEATGEVGPETWKALGTLLTEDPPAPEPSEINNATLATKPADSLSGPPFVTCRA